MLTYDECKRLKEVGFPQMTEDGNGNNLCECDDLKYDLSALSTLGVSHKRAYAPTLEELIEVCVTSGGYIAFQLDWVKSRDWHAKMASLVDKPEAFGSSPIQAVCNLYLKLHENN